MPRSKSISSFETGSSPSPPSSSHASVSPSTRTLKKSSSFADLAKRQLKRFKGKGDFDFGCQGDSGQEIVEEEELEEEVPASRAPSTRPRLPFPMTPNSPPPARPQASFETIDESLFTPDQLRSLRRQKEEALAADACLEYIQTTRTHQHRRQHSRNHSRSSSITSFPALDRLNLHDRDPTTTPASSSQEGFRPRSDSTTSSLCSSRPRTNDSLPSFAGSDTTTCSSAGSYPPSPVQTSRPTFSGGVPPILSSKKLDHNQQPRAYAFI